MKPKLNKRLIGKKELENLAIGATVLGSGGGGNTNYELLLAKHKVDNYGPIDLISIQDLSKDDLIVPVAFMGAPLVFTEKLSSGKEFKAIIESIEKHFSKKPTAIMSAEIGGANALTAFKISAQLGLPVLDADLLSRAFPELQINSAALKNIPLCPAFLADCHANSIIINTNDNFKLEAFARSITVEMGSSAALAVALMTGEQAKKAAISGTVTQAILIGEIITNAKKNNINPVKELVKKIDAKFIGSGAITNIEQSIKSGFLKGNVTIENKDLELTILIEYQNENLIAYANNKVVATTPDIITILDSQTGIAITTDALLYGVQVSIIAIRANEIWQTKEGLKLVSPKAFGYDIDYNPV